MARATPLTSATIYAMRTTTLIAAPRLQLKPQARPALKRVAIHDSPLTITKPAMLAVRPVTRGVALRAHVRPLALRSTRAVTATPMIGDTPPEVRLNPYVAFSGKLTFEGGIELTYRDLDTRFFRKLCQFVIWAALTGLAAWWLFARSNFEPLSQWIALGVTALALKFLCFRTKEIARTIEIRPDGMVLDGADVFWLDRMELGWPEFLPDQAGDLVLQGVYGTRFVEYLTVRRFDPLDRSPEVLAAHVQRAMQQLWNYPNRA